MNLTDEQRWQAVLERDSAHDGSFVTAVRTTGIFCRPSCPARTPKRANIQFFGLPELAESAGFRACKRCRPLEAKLEDPGMRIVRRVCQVIDTRPDGVPNLGKLAAAGRVSAGHLQRTFKRVVGISPREYAEARRLGRLKQYLRSESSVSRAQYAAGLGSSSRLYERSGKHLGMTPATYRKGGEGASITYGFARSSLGNLLVGATKQGICAVKLGNSRRDLAGELKEEFPAAAIRRDDDALDEYLAAVVRLAEGEGSGADLPLDVHATAFQRRIWQLLQAIPTGETRTYGELARAAGFPRAARAVGRACATNQVALVIPCHRVVPAQGSVGGYRWGPEKKKRLLEIEAGRQRPKRDAKDG